VWRDTYGLEPLYASLVKLRGDLPVLRSGSLRLLSTDHDDTVLAYERENAGAQTVPDEDVVIVINFGAEPVSIQLRPNSAAMRPAPAEPSPGSRARAHVVSAASAVPPDAGTPTNTPCSAVVPLAGRTPELEPGDARSSEQAATAARNGEFAPTDGCLRNVLSGDRWLGEDLLTHARVEFPPDAATLPLAPHDALLLRPSRSRHPTAGQ
jgi:hypothetical protein